MASPTSSIQTETATEDGTSPAPRSGLARRGDGFSVGETEGLLQLVRERWQEGWDVIADVHNQQYPGHNRSGPSLKRKFGKLYRTKLDDPGVSHKVARLAALAKDVREEMRGRRPPRSRTISVEPVTEANFLEKEEPVLEQAVETQIVEPVHTHDAPRDAEPSVSLDREIRQSLEQTDVLETQEVEQSAVLEQEEHRETDWEASIARSSLEAVRLRALRTRIETPRDVTAATGSADEDLLRTVLILLLDAQRQRELEREEEREQRRKEEARRREEEREERRRHEQERAEDRRRHEQYMQMMTTMMAKIAGNRVKPEQVDDQES